MLIAPPSFQPSRNSQLSGLLTGNGSWSSGTSHSLRSAQPVKLIALEYLSSDHVRVPGARSSL
jgi:hypothetical protein